MPAAAGGACEDESERQRLSPSVVARLMGLGTLPFSHFGVADLPEKKVELQRSASESRSRDPLHYQTYESGNGGRDWSNIDDFRGDLRRELCGIGGGVSEPSRAVSSWRGRSPAAQKWWIIWRGRYQGSVAEGWEDGIENWGR